jgi:alkylresorcinol/alkylpyrone synthase
LQDKLKNTGLGVGEPILPLNKWNFFPKPITQTLAKSCLLLTDGTLRAFKREMQNFAFIHSISNAVPEFKATQADAMKIITEVFKINDLDQARIANIFKNTGITERYISAPLNWYTEAQTWASKNNLYLLTSLKLLKEVAVEALEKAKWLPQEVDHIVVVSTTGIATPSLDAHLMNLMPFRQDVTRTPIFGLGCAGGLLGMDRAALIAKGAPGSKVLLLVVELCSLSFQKNKLDKKGLIASALFADGAAAVTVSTEKGYVKILGTMERTWPDTLGVMGWEVEDTGFSVIFSKSIPDLVRDKMKPFVSDFFSQNKITLPAIKKFISHPGGAKVMDALENCFELRTGQMMESRETLANFGNMSAPTVLFALKTALQSRVDKLSREKWLLSTLGPGFTGALILLEV